MGHSRSNAFALSAAFVIASATLAVAAPKALKVGSPRLESAGRLAFGPNGVLFVADSRGAAIYAIETEDAKQPTGLINVDAIDVKIAAMLGIAPKNLLIRDVAVSPTSGKAYVAVARGRGPEAKPAIVRVDNSGKLELLSLKKVKFSKAELLDAPSRDAKDRRQRPLRAQSITDIEFVDGKLLVAGLSNEEFASTLRSIPFPFDDVKRGTGVEIFHGAHGKLETHAPVRTFVPFTIEGQMQLLAAYTCTPLVRFPVSDLKAGAKVRGTTIAELGNRNRPLDMITYKKEGKDWLLLANDRRGVMKITTDGIMEVEPVTEHVKGGGKAGISYETIEAWKRIYELDRLGENYAIVLRKTSEETYNLESRPLP